MSEPHTTGTGPLDDAAPHAPHLPVVDVSESGMTSTPLQSAMGHARLPGRSSSSASTTGRPCS